MELERNEPGRIVFKGLPLSARVVVAAVGSALFGFAFHFFVDAWTTPYVLPHFLAAQPTRAPTLIGSGLGGLLCAALGISSWIRALPFRWELTGEPPELIFVWRRRRLFRRQLGAARAVVIRPWLRKKNNRWHYRIDAQCARRDIPIHLSHASWAQQRDARPHALAAGTEIAELLLCPLVEEAWDIDPADNTLYVG